MAPTLRHPFYDPLGAGEPAAVVPGPGVPGPVVTPAALAGAEDTLAVIHVAASDPPRPETVVLFLDDAHVGRGCCVVSGTTAPDDVFDVGALAAEVAGRSPDLHAVVLATVRPGSAAGADTGGDAGAEHDIARWLVLLDLFDEVGVDLLDWFVLGPGHGVRSLRAHTGPPAPWRGG